MNIHKTTIKSSACFSDDGKYRYWLHRRWNDQDRVGMFICINPSKADDLRTDITACNCNTLAAIWGWGGFYISNLYAYIDTNPKKLNESDKYIGSDNDSHIKELSKKVDIVVLSCGNDFKKRQREVLELIDSNKLYCIKKNKSRGYLHPSRINPFDYKEPIKI